MFQLLKVLFVRKVKHTISIYYHLTVHRIVDLRWIVWSADGGFEVDCVVSGWWIWGTTIPLTCYLLSDCRSWSFDCQTIIEVCVRFCAVQLEEFSHIICPFSCYRVPLKSDEFSISLSLPPGLLVTVVYFLLGLWTCMCSVNVFFNIRERK